MKRCSPMRKGRPRNDWTTEELRYLRANAGVIPVREICRHLKRTYDSVERKARRMRLSLRCYRPHLQWCTKCASWRQNVSPKTGQCLVCTRREQLEQAKMRTAEAYDALSRADKLIYDENLAKRVSKIPPKPKPPKPAKRSRYEEAKVEEAYQAALDRWEIKRLERLINNEKQTTKNMRKKTRSNPRKKSNQ